MSNPRPYWLTPAPIVWGADGTPRSEVWDDVYFSAVDGAQESRHVFLEHNGLPQRWRDHRTFTVAELGFGTGLNFLVTWEAWRRDQERPSRLVYFSLERAPLAPDDIRRTAARWPELAPLAAELLSVYPPARRGFHLVNLEQGAVALILAFGEAAELLPQLNGHVDAWYLDGFAPAKNPELWEGKLFDEMARLSAAGTTFATFTAAAEVRRGLTERGFKVEKFKGFGPKRESLCGTFEPCGTIPKVAQKSVAVIGGGLSGLAAAEALTRRGVVPTLFEREAELCSGASGNPRGVVYPYFSADPAPRTRLYHTGFDFILRELSRLDAAACEWVGCGAVQLPSTKRIVKLFERFAAEPDLFGPGTRLLNPAESAAITGVTLDHLVLWSECAGYLSPRQLGASYLKRIGAAAVRGEAITKLSDKDGKWAVTLRDQELQFDAVILANAFEAGALAPQAPLPLDRVRGQIAQLPATPNSAALKTILCYEGYTLPARNGRHLIGASYDHELDTTELLPEVQRDLLRRLSHWAPTLGLAPSADDTGRVSFRATTPDRMPLVGPVPGSSGLYILSGFGSRGLSSIGIAAEALAAQIAGELVPLEQDVIAALDPRRFA